MSTSIQVPEFIATGVFDRPVPKVAFLPDIDSSTNLLDYYQQARQMFENAQDLIEKLCDSDFARFSAEALAEKEGVCKKGAKFEMNEEGVIQLTVESSPKVSLRAPSTHAPSLTEKVFPVSNRVFFQGIQHREKPIIFSAKKALSEGEIEQVDLTSEEMPKPKSFKRAVLKVLGKVTGHDSSIWVLADDVIDLVLQEVGIDPSNSPWPVYHSDDEGRSYQTLKRNVTYAYRNSKEGYNNDTKALFRATEKPRAWALTDIGARKSEVFTSDLKGEMPESINMATDIDELFDEEILPENNRTLAWVQERGEKLRLQLLKAAEKFRISKANGLLEDHVHEFLFDMIRRDKIGKWSDRRDGKMPTLSHVKSWLSNHITDQLENSAKEPVCRALYGAETKAIRKSKKRIKEGSDKRSDHRWAKSCVDRPETACVAQGREKDDSVRMDFVCPNSQNSIESGLSLDQMISSIAKDFSAHDQDEIRCILRGLSDGDELNMSEQMIQKLRASAAKVAKDSDMCHLIPESIETKFEGDVFIHLLSEDNSSTGFCMELSL